jgi:hypothetical protein
LQGSYDQVWRGRIRSRLNLAIIIYVFVIVLAIYGAFMGPDLEDPMQRLYLWILVVAGILYGLMVTTYATEVRVEIENGTLEVEVTATMLRYRKSVIRTVKRDQLAKVYEKVVRGIVHNVILRDELGRNLAAFPRFLDEGGHAEMIAAIIEWGDQPSGASSEPSEPR